MLDGVEQALQVVVNVAAPVVWRAELDHDPDLADERSQGFRPDDPLDGEAVVPAGLRDNHHSTDVRVIMVDRRRPGQLEL